jgi:hypothetical protein
MLPLVRWFVVFLACVGCSTEAPALVVDLRTDYVPDDEFVAARVVVRSGAVLVNEARESVGRTDDFSRGSRVAEFGGLAAGEYEIELSLIDASDSIVASRLQEVAISGTRGVTVIVTRDCGADTCAAPLTCHGGRCVEPACNVDSPLECGVAECSLPSDCTGGASCAAAECVLGACLWIADHDACGGGRCHPEDGCSGATDSGVVPGLDAGERDDGGLDAGTAECVAEVCNGRDDDCDRDVDEGFECQSGGSEACVTACGGISGHRVCGATCTYGTCGASDEACDNGCDDDLDSSVDEGCGSLHDTCAEAIDVTAGGTFHASTCGGNSVLDLACGVDDTPEVLLRIAEPGGSYTFTPTAGFIVEIIHDPCRVSGACDVWGTPWLLGSGGTFLAIERQAGGCGAFTVNVSRE